MQLIQYFFILALVTVSASSNVYGGDFEYSQNSLSGAFDLVIDELTAVQKTISYYSLVKNKSEKEGVEWYVSTFRGGYLPLYGEIIFQDQGFVVFKALKFLREKKATLNPIQKIALSEAILTAYQSLDQFGQYRFGLYFDEVLAMSQSSLIFDTKTVSEFDKLAQESWARTLKVAESLKNELSLYNL